jgi:hypothetical protein
MTYLQPTHRNRDFRVKNDLRRQGIDINIKLRLEVILPEYSEPPMMAIRSILPFMDGYFDKSWAMLVNGPVATMVTGDDCSMIV